MEALRGYELADKLVSDKEFLLRFSWTKQQAGFVPLSNGTASEEKGHQEFFWTHVVPYDVYVRKISGTDGERFRMDIYDFENTVGGTNRDEVKHVYEALAGQRA